MRSKLSPAIIFWSLILALFVCVFWFPQPFQKAHAQAGPVVLTSTTTAAAQTATQTTISLTTATGKAQSDGSIAVPSQTAGAFIVYVDREAERVIAATGSATIWTVQRGWGGSAQAAHATARPVWFGLEGRFKISDPPGIGACTSPVEVIPWINILNGMKWMCRSSAWAATNSMNVTYNSDVGQTNTTP